MVLERLTKQNETLNVSSLKLTSSREVKTNKDEVETSLQVMVDATEFKALEAPEYPGRPFCGLKMAYCQCWTQENGDGLVQESMETESGKEWILPLRPLRPEDRILNRTSAYDVATMAPVLIAFTQINLQQCKSASAVLARCVSKLQTNIVLVQEPWLNKGNISRLRTCEQRFSANILHFSSKEGIERKVVVCSA